MMTEAVLRAPILFPASSARAVMSVGFNQPDVTATEGA
jgi:hypothetical protein